MKQGVPSLAPFKPPVKGGSERGIAGNFFFPPFSAIQTSRPIDSQPADRTIDQAGRNFARVSVQTPNPDESLLHKVFGIIRASSLLPGKEQKSCPVLGKPCLPYRFGIHAYSICALKRKQGAHLSRNPKKTGQERKHRISDHFFNFSQTSWKMAPQMQTASARAKLVLDTRQL